MFSKNSKLSVLSKLKFQLTIYMIFSPNNLSFMNIDSNPKRNSLPKFILQKETLKKQEKYFKIAMKIDILAVHPKDSM